MNKQSKANNVKLKPYSTVVTIIQHFPDYTTCSCFTNTKKRRQVFDMEKPTYSNDSIRVIDNRLFR